MGAVPAGPLGKDPERDFPDWYGGQDSTGGFWPNRRGAQISARPGTGSWAGKPASEGNKTLKKKIEIATIPELGTSVGMHGSMRQKEVGGIICLALVAILYSL